MWVPRTWNATRASKSPTHPEKEQDALSNINSPLK